MSTKLEYIFDSEVFIDLYNILEIESDATPEKIKKEYLRLSKKHHPDQGGNSELFQEVTRAYEILYNKDTRKEYDLYYLKKNMDELDGNDLMKLKTEHEEFIKINNKPMTKEKLDEIYNNIFQDRVELKEEKLEETELNKRLNDINLERENVDIDSLDNRLFNMIKESNSNLTVNDVYEYIKMKNKNENKEIILNSINTLDTLPNYNLNYSSLMDDVDSTNYGLNIYDAIYKDNDITKENIEIDKLNLEEINNWRNKKIQDIRLSSEDIDSFLKKRKEEEDEICNKVELNLNKDIKQVEKFLKNNHIKEEIESSTEISKETTIFDYMDDVNDSINTKKSNIRKREFK